MFQKVMKEFSHLHSDACLKQGIDIRSSKANKIRTKALDLIRSVCIQPTESQAMAGPVRVYAVKKGRRVGLFSSYAEVTQQTHGFPGAQQRSFSSIQEAEAYLRDETAPAQIKPKQPVVVLSSPLEDAAVAQSLVPLGGGETGEFEHDAAGTSRDVFQSLCPDLNLDAMDIVSPID
jgi:hypothetical protein